MGNLFRKEIERHFSSSRPYQALRSAFKGERISLRVHGPKGGYLSLLLAELHGRGSGGGGGSGAGGAGRGGPSLVVVPTEREAESLQQDIATFRGEASAVLFPWWGVAAYESTSPLPSVFGERVSVLARLLERDPLLLIAPLRALLTPVPDPEYLAAQVLTVRRGETLDPQRTADRLARAGYLRVPTVSIHGEMAIRGEVVDVFVPGHDQAARITLDFDEVKDIRWFNPLDQSSTGTLEEIAITPCREVCFAAEEEEALRASLAELGFGPEEVEQAVSRVRDDPEASGAELFYPLCFASPFSVLDYLGEGATVFLMDRERLAVSAAALRKEYLELFRRARALKQIVPGPQKILLDFSALVERMPRQVDFPMLPPSAPAARGEGGAPAGAAAAQAGTSGSFALPSDGPRSFFGNFTFFREEMEESLRNGYAVFIFAVYDVQADRLRNILKDLDVQILPLSISAGFMLPDSRILVVQENEIFGRKRRIPRSVGSAKSAAIESFVELSPGDFVVHVNYGIGVFLGIERISAAGNERDYIRLEYADGEKLFIPIEQVNLIQRYIGQEGRQPKLDSMGGKGWQKRKERAQKAVEDLAHGLLELYSRRKAEPGFAFPPDTDWQSEFEAAFPYQETEDQLTCIRDVKTDMEKPTVMDRLVCGDVGYGKTEIALRAAFKAVMGGRQVALLAPTTILVDQHYETFRERFERFPVKVEMLSRFRHPKEMKAAIAAAAAGDVDIVIGTHRLIQKDVAFRNLGLLIVDEEQRFGVKHKERLKQLKTSVDCLTLTATPIPRTLNMSLMKVRDMSILNTAPQNRLPIETYVTEFNEELAARAIR
ncbi:MAG: DEAD/DEAH box helicase, partial [Spirochaetes bacterium]|nr:DEAD/DEAH box helicase [Spirochaetota bacterium]